MPCSEKQCSGEGVNTWTIHTAPGFYMVEYQYLFSLKHHRSYTNSHTDVTCS